MVIGISRTADSDTAINAAARDAPEVIAPISTTFDGNAQIVSTMNSTCQTVSPASRASPEKPVNAPIRINAGNVNRRKSPLPYQ